MHAAFIARDQAAESVPIWFVSRSNWQTLRQSLDQQALAYADSAGFQPTPGRYLALRGPGGRIGSILFAIEGADAKYRDRFLSGLLPERLPAGAFRFANAPHDTRLACLAFALGCYRFDRYVTEPDKQVQLVLPDGVDGEDLSRIVEGVVLARDLINTPANDMGPDDLDA